LWGIVILGEIIVWKNVIFLGFWEAKTVAVVWLLVYWGGVGTPA